MFGMGLWEMLIVLMVGGVFVAVIIAVITASTRGNRSFERNYIAQLEEENLRLRKLLAEHGIHFSSGQPPSK